MSARGADDFLVMREIAPGLNTTSHQLGRYLTTDGLRENGRPSPLAFQEGWVMPYKLDCGITSWKWSLQRVLDWWQKRSQQPKNQQPGV